MTAIDVHIPNELLAALESGEISHDQLCEFARIEAEAIGMSFAEAVTAAHQRALPKTPIGMDLESLILMIEHDVVAPDSLVA